MSLNSTSKALLKEDAQAAKAGMYGFPSMGMGIVDTGLGGELLFRVVPPPELNNIRAWGFPNGLLFNGNQLALSSILQYVESQPIRISEGQARLLWTVQTLVNLAYGVPVEEGDESLWESLRKPIGAAFLDFYLRIQAHKRMNQALASTYFGIEHVKEILALYECTIGLQDGRSLFGVQLVRTLLLACRGRTTSDPVLRKLQSVAKEALALVLTTETDDNGKHPVVEQWEAEHDANNPYYEDDPGSYAMFDLQANIEQLVLQVMQEWAVMGDGSFIFRLKDLDSCYTTAEHPNKLHTRIAWPAASV